MARKNRTTGKKKTIIGRPRGVPKKIISANVSLESAAILAALKKAKRFSTSDAVDYAIRSTFKDMVSPAGPAD